MKSDPRFPKRWRHVLIIAWIALGYVARLWFMGLIGLFPFAWVGLIFDGKLSIGIKIGTLVIVAASLFGDLAIIIGLPAILFAGIGTLLTKMLELPAKAATAREIGRTLEAANWAREQSDLPLAEWQLLERIEELDGAEENAWLEFKRTWKPGTRINFRMAYEDFFGGNSTDYCRDEFLRSWSREAQWTAHARLNAVRAEMEYLRKRLHEDE